MKEGKGVKENRMMQNETFGLGLDGKGGKTGNIILKKKVRP